MQKAVLQNCEVAVRNSSHLTFPLENICSVDRVGRDLLSLRNLNGYIGSIPIHCAAGNLIVVIRQIDLFICGRERVLYGSIPAPGV